MKSLIKKLLNESLDSLPYASKIEYFDVEETGEISYSFQTYSDEKIEVNFVVLNKHSLLIDFLLDYSWFSDETKKPSKNIFKLYSTVINICQDVISKLGNKGIDIKYLVYDADKKKGKIYSNIIKRLSPNASFTKDNYGSTVAKIKQLLRETLFHGTNRKELNWDNRTDDPDYNMLGYGIYLTDIKDEAEYYAKERESGDKYVHTFKPINANIVSWDGPLPNSVLDYVKNNPDFFKKHKTNKGLVFDIDPTIFYGITGVNNDELNTKNMLLSVANFYTFLYYKLGSTKKASEFLVKLGIDGVTKQQDTSDFGYSDKKPNVTVIFNPNKFKKIKTYVLK